MIHDILLSCLNLHSRRLAIEEFVVANSVSPFLHPCEKKILIDIGDIINLLREVANFSKVYGSNLRSEWKPNLRESDEPLQSGLYLKAFAKGIDTVLEEYLEDVRELERRYLHNSSQSLMFIYQRIQMYEPLALFLRKLIRTIRLKKLHGCGIIQYIYENSQHGDIRIHNALKMIQTSINAVFLKQLTHWILYAKILDTYGEFFIQCVEVRNNTTVGSERTTSNGSGKTILATLSDAASTYADIWRYEINFDLLPNCFSCNWVEKVLFIGQTVLIFNVDANKSNKLVETWNKSYSDTVVEDISLWNENEHIYFGKIQALQNERELSVRHYERVIDEIKGFVSIRLSEIAINQADLLHQLKLIKNCYLLGRGELFLEFIRLTYSVEKGNDKDNKLRDYIRAFESAANSVGATEDLEQFTLSVAKSSEIDETDEVGYLHPVKLEYKIIWPLQLLFSPMVIERYNLLFRFLLMLKQIQYELHMIWCSQNYKSKHDGPTSVPVISLRNQIMFFINNLQYYIQVDVLESQFSILLNTITNKADFEQIQKAHSVFQANILSLCFLLSDDDMTKVSLCQSRNLYEKNPILIIIGEIIEICKQFCLLFDTKMDNDEINNEAEVLDERFALLVEQLIKLLVDLKTIPNSTTPLSQLLLRLDFNHWFSIKKSTVPQKGSE